MADRNTEAVFVFSPALAGFELSPDHPFKPERSRLTFEMCAERGLLTGGGVRIDEFGEPEEGLLETFTHPNT